MDNRRPTSENAPRPSDRTNNYQKEGDQQSAPRRYPPRDNQYQPRNDRFQPRNNDRFQSRDNRQGSGVERSPINRDDRQRSGDNRFQARDNRNPPPSNTGGGRFQPRSNDRNDRNDQNDRNDRNDRFQPRGRFAPKGPGFIKPWEKPPARIVSEMQVTDGKHRGKYLQATPAEKVKPTARRIREVLFRILYRRVRAGRFLDLCAGAGSVGIEAISRGAMISTFVERSGQMCGIIKKNLESMDIKEGHGEINHIEVVPFLKKMAKRKRHWDIAYFNPPSDSNYDEVLNYFSRGVALKPGGLLIIEHPKEMLIPEKFGVMSRWRVVEQGETTITFYEKRQA